MKGKNLQKPQQLTKAVVRLRSQTRAEQSKERLLRILNTKSLYTADSKTNRELIKSAQEHNREATQRRFSMNELAQDLLAILKNDKGIFTEQKDFIVDGPNQIFMDGKLKHLTDGNVLSGSFQYAISTFLGCMAYRQPDGSMKVVRIQDQIKRLRDGSAALGWKLEYTDEQIAEAIQWTADNAAKKQGTKNSADVVYIRPFAFSNAKNYGISGLAMNKYIDLVFEAEYFDYLGGSQKLHIPEDLRRDELHPDKKHSAQYHKIRELADRIKTSSSLHNEKGEPKYTGGVMLDKKDNITEMANNIFFIKGKSVVTPKIGEILPGLTRDTVIKLLELRGYTTEEADIKPNELDQYEACFTTGTASACKEVELINYQDTDYSFDKNNTIVKQIKQDYLHFVSGNFNYFEDQAKEYVRLADSFEAGVTL